MRKVGLFGGSFDPIHSGHLAVARTALTEVGLDEVIFIPAATSPFKIGRMQASDEQRMEMLRLAIRDEPHFSASDYELQQAGVSYTVNTVRHFVEVLRNAELYFILGADSLASLSQWCEAHELIKLCSFIALARTGSEFDAASILGESFKDDLRVTLIRDFQHDVSSTELRERLAGGMPLEGMVPAAVEAYIREQRIYPKQN